MNWDLKHCHNFAIFVFCKCLIVIFVNMKKFIVIGIFCLFNIIANAQNGGVKGFVYDESTGEPIMFATVKVMGENIGAQTDVNGFFNIPKILIGTYKLVTTYSGFDSTQTDVLIELDNTNSIKIMLHKKSKKIGNVIISGKKSEKQLETRVGATKITTKEIKALPSIGGEPDIAQYLQVMPGVTFTGDQGGQLYIRGGSPVQNKILLDGMTIYNPFHSIGLFSVFETEGIRTADVMSGGFGVEYGDRTSAIVNISTKDGNKNRTSGKVGVSPILAKVFLEGPLMKQKTIGGPSLTYVASLKHSYLNKTSDLYKFVGTNNGQGLPFSFTDLYGKVCLNAGSGSKFNFFGFNFKDDVNFTGSQFGWNNFGAGSNFVISPAASNSLITGGFYYSGYGIQLVESDKKPRKSNINGFDANIAITSYGSRNSELKYGFEVNGFSTVYEFYNYLGIQSDQNENTTQIGSFVKYKVYSKNSKFIFEPGVRMQYYASMGIFSPEPRLAMKYNFSKSFRVKAAAGRYSQNLISTKSDKDIVNLFTGFLTGPDIDLFKPDGTPSKNNIQYANHVIGGIELDIKDVELTLEPWLKDFRQLITFNRYKTSPSQSDYLIETGIAKGLDLTMKYSKNRLYLWTALSLGSITRYDGKQTYPPPFDRRYNVNIVASYYAGKKQDIELSARFNYGSAFPFTLTQSLYENINFSQTGLNTDYLGQNGSLDIVYDTKINDGRLSDYHRLDLSAKKKFEINEHSEIDVTFGLTNAYNRKNIFYMDRITNARQYQLPIFPTLAVSFGF
jgi:hypothetical protein